MKAVHIKAVARKEFYHLIRDFRSLYLAFIIPLLLIVMFGYALRLDVENIKTVIVDYDKTFLSRDFINKLEASPYFEITGYLQDSKSAESNLDKGPATLAIIIPPDWTRELKADREVSIQVLLDGSDPNNANITLGYISGFIEKYNGDQLKIYLDRQGLKKINPPAEPRIRVWFNEDLESKNFIIPGIIAIIIIIVGALMTSLVIAREYENGTMESIISLPISGTSFIIGKAIPYFFIGLVDVLIAILMGQVLFGVVMKASFWLMVLASILYLWVALSLGLLISIATRSQLVANQIALLITYLPSFMLSDFVFPINNMPTLFQLVTNIIPAKYFINILKGLYLRNLGLTQMWHDYLILFIMFLILSIITVIKLKKEGL
ncbi:ABC transporter permease [Thermodesulfobacteriota bacterium]